MDVDGKGKGKGKEKYIKESSSKKKENGVKESEHEKDRPLGRQSAISSTVNKREIANRILDLPLSVTVREMMETAKEVRAEFQDMVKVNNVKAVLLGGVHQHPILANWGWPRLNGGVLIKVELETAGTKVCAIIDTGSQLNIARADIAALKIRRSVDM
ncbi:hypothetical protein C8F04DRAFT_984161, partial [Mycena alexandri]